MWGGGDRDGVGGGRHGRHLKKFANRPVIDVIVLEPFTKELTLEYLAQVGIIRFVIVLMRSNVIKIIRECFR